MVQGRYEILNQSVELPARHLHRRVRVLHAASRVLAWPPGRFADLIDEHLRQPPQVGLTEFVVDPGIAGDSIPEIFNNCGDGLDPAKPVRWETSVSFHP